MAGPYYVRIDNELVENDVSVSMAVKLVPQYFDLTSAGSTGYREVKRPIPKEREERCINVFPASKFPNFSMDGGTKGTRAGIKVFGDESVEKLAARIYHELLHTLKLPADFMQHYAPEFLTARERLLYRFHRATQWRFCPKWVWETRFYHWLLTEYEQGREFPLQKDLLDD